MSDHENLNKNWCFRSETARLLALNVAQIHTGLSEGDSSIDTLSNSFQQLANFCEQINQLDAEQDLQQIQQIKDIAGNMSGHVTGAIVAFQFYDRLCQRLEHVQDNLHMLSELVTDTGHIDSSEGWQSLRDKIKSSYTMETEHKMYDAVMAGASIEEALELFKAELAKQDEQDDIELF